MKEIRSSLTELNWHRVVQRRSFLDGIGAAAAAALRTTALFAAEKEGYRDRDDRPLSRSDVAVLRLATGVALIESDLWQQYGELRGAVDHNDNPTAVLKIPI